MYEKIGIPNKEGSSTGRVALFAIVGALFLFAVIVIPSLLNFKSPFYKEDWTLAYFGSPSYNGNSQKIRIPGYKSSNECVVAGYNFKNASTDEREWFECSEGCKPFADGSVYVCDKVYDSRYGKFRE